MDPFTDQSHSVDVHSSLTESIEQLAKMLRIAFIHPDLGIGEHRNQIYDTMLIET